MAITATPLGGSTLSVAFEVPEVLCVRCDERKAVNPTRVEGLQAVSWDAPPGWSSARVEGATHRVLYLCGACFAKAPLKTLRET
jgi:hypothetical protein